MWHKLVLLLIVIILVVGYLLWPLDLLPDIIPLIGWIDDLIIGFGGLIMGIVILLRG